MALGPEVHIYSRTLLFPKHCFQYAIHNKQYINLKQHMTQRKKKKKKIIAFFPQLCWLFRAGTLTCFDCLGRGRGVCEVTHEWSHALATPWECSPHTKTFLILLKAEFSVKF